MRLVDLTPSKSNASPSKNPARFALNLPIEALLQPTKAHTNLANHNREEKT